MIQTVFVIHIPQLVRKTESFTVKLEFCPELCASIAGLQVGHNF